MPLSNKEIDQIIAHETKFFGHKLGSLQRIGPQAKAYNKLKEEVLPSLKILLEEYHLRVFTGKWLDQIDLLKERIRALQSLIKTLEE